MAVDVVGDVAVTLFARRGVGCVLSETWVLGRLGASWRLLGGGGETADRDLLHPRPTRLPQLPGQPPAADAGIDPGVIAIEGGGGVHDGGAGADRWPWSGRWIRYVVLRTSAEVGSLTLDGRTLVVPWRGQVVLASTRRRSPRVVVNGTGGGVVGEVRPFEQMR
jgi:hypothetical protein